MGTNLITIKNIYNEDVYVFKHIPDIKPRYVSLFLDRRCSKNCGYCNAKNIRGERRLTAEEWIEGFKILEQKGIVFFLIIGNEILYYPEIVKFVRLLKENGFYGKYAFYTVFSEPQNTELKYKLIENGLYNISCGVDIPEGCSVDDKSIDSKSIIGLENLKWYRQHGVKDTQATITLSRKNFRYVEKLLDIVSAEGIWSVINLIEENRYNAYDFFAKYDDIKEFIITEDVLDELKNVLDRIIDKQKRGKILLQCPVEYLEDAIKYGWKLNWHCNNLLILHFEEDGNVRSCSYSNFLNKKYNILDLKDDNKYNELLEDLKEAIYKCPGCYWGYPWMAEFYLTNNNLDSICDKKFQSHFSEYIHTK